MTLNYDGLTEEQIREFVDNTSLNVEVDAVFTYGPTTKGILYEDPIEEGSPTGWLSGSIIGIEINDNMGMHHKDLVLQALEAYKKAKGDLKDAQQILAEEIPMLKIFL